MTLTRCGGMDIEEVDKKIVAMVPFDPLTGLRAFVMANALSEIGAPQEIVSPLVQQLPKLWVNRGRNMDTRTPASHAVSSREGLVPRERQSSCWRCARTTPAGRGR